jgi:hypothetical protein
MKRIWLFLLFFACTASSFAQNLVDSLDKKEEGITYGTTTIDGKVIPIMIIDGDTLPTINTADVKVSRRKVFDNREDKKRFYQWRKYAAKVYPYALEAVRLYRQIQKETSEMKKGKRKKYTRDLEKKLTPKYETELKQLTKSQGFILIKMVERELDKPFYDVVKTIRGGWDAIKWQTVGSFYGYNLRKGYHPTDDEVLEMIFSDLDLSYEYGTFLK